MKPGRGASVWSAHRATADSALPRGRVWYRDSMLRASDLSGYRARGAGEPPGRDFFFRFDSSLAWVEVVCGRENLRSARRANPAWEADHRTLAFTLGAQGGRR